MKQILKSLACLSPSLSIVVALSFAGQAKSNGANVAKSFSTAQEAASALVAAVKTYDRDALRVLFGDAVEEIANADRVQATNEFTTFAAALAQGSHLTPQTTSKYILEVGTNSWPFPIPIVEQNGRWSFDTASGQDELLNRRIGKNELEVLEVVRAYVDAQRQYASRDRDDDEVLEYAQRLASSPGTKDGLYWPLETYGEESPLGPLVAQAQSAGYFGDDPIDKFSPQPFYGYYFKILTRQGKHAPGGKYNYIINGNMIAGFALIAWPADYGDSGVMTFIVNQQGRVYQKDLGASTAKIAKKMSEYDPDGTWKVSKD